MNHLIRLNTTAPLFLILFLLGCFALSPTTRAVSPAPSSSNTSGGNTASGAGADQTGPVIQNAPEMSADAKKTLVRRLFEEVWNHNNLETAKEIVDNHFSSIENQVFVSTPGPEIVAADIKLYQSLYDGLNFQIERMFTEGDTVVTVWKASGVSKRATFTNRAGKTVPKSLKAEGVSLTEVKDGKITAHRFLWPRYALFP